MNLGDLLLRVGADVATWELLKSTLHNTRDQLQEFAEGAEKIGLLFDAAFTLPMEKAGEALLQFGENLKAATNTIIQTTGASGEALQGLSESYRAVLAQVDASSADVAGSLGQLATRFDLVGEPLERMTKLMEDLSKVTGEQMVPLTTETARLLQLWGISAEDAAATLDHLVQVSMASGGSFKSLTETLQHFGPAFKEMGLGIEDVSNLIGNLEKSGVNVQPALQGMQKALNGMTKAGLKDPLEGLQLLVEKIRDASTEGEAFGIGANAFGKGAATLVSAIRDGKFSLDDFVGSLKLSNRTVTDTAAEMTTLGQKFEQIKNQIQVALQPLGEDLVKILENLLEACRPVIEFITILADRFQSLPTPVKEVIFGIAAFVAAIGPLLGILGAVALAIDALAAPLAVMLGVLGGPTGLVVVAALFGAALAGWAIYDAVTKAEKLVTTLNSLYDVMERGGQATADQAEQIGNLTAVLEGHNKTLGAKQVVVPKTDANDNVLPNEEYIKNLKTAVAGLEEFKGKQRDAMKLGADGAYTVNLNMKELTSSVEAVGVAVKKTGDAHQKFSNDALVAYGKLTKSVSEYKRVTEEIKRLQEEEGGAKALPIKLLELADLRRKVFTPTATDADVDMLGYYNEIIKLNRASYMQTSDDVLKLQADLVAKLRIAGMDTAQAFSLLGVTSTADLDRQVQEIEAALAKVKSSSLATADDRVRATIAASEREIAIWRQEGAAIADQVITTTNAVRAAWAAAHVDIGQAFSNLGVKSVSDVNNALLVEAASLAKIQESVKAGTASQVDADNAEIASLTRKAAAFAAIGKQMSDTEVARLLALRTNLQAAAMTTDQAFNLLGLPSQDQLDAQLQLIETAYKKIADSEESTIGQVNAARAAELSRMVAAYRSAGQQVTTDMITEWKNRSLAAQTAALDIDQAFKILNTLSVADATRQLELLDAAFNRVVADSTSTAQDVQNAMLAKLQASVNVLRQSGQAASDEIIHQLDALKLKALLSVMTIDDAFKQLGITSTESIHNSYLAAQAALDKITADMKSSALDRLQAQIAANDAYYKDMVATGQKVDEYQHAQDVLASQRIKAALADQQNIFLAFADTIKQVYGAIQQDLGDVITGAKSLGQAFMDIGQQIEKALVQFVVKNLLLTQDTLNKLTDSLLGFMKDMLGVTAGAAKPIVSAAAGTAGSAASGVTSAGGAAASGAGGVLSSLASVATVVGAAAQVIGGIVNGIQQAHANTLLTRIEESTRRADITLEGPDGIAHWMKMSGLHLGSIESILWQPIVTLLIQMNADLDAIAVDGNRTADQLTRVVAILARAFNLDTFETASADLQSAAADISAAGPDLSNAAAALGQTSASLGSSYVDYQAAAQTLQAAGSGLVVATYDMSQAAAQISSTAADVAGVVQTSALVLGNAASTVAAAAAVTQAAATFMIGGNALGSGQGAAPTSASAGATQLAGYSPGASLLSGPGAAAPSGGQWNPWVSGVAPAGWQGDVIVTGNNISSQRDAENLGRAITDELRKVAGLRM